MKRFVIERELPGVGSMSQEQLSRAAAKSNAALAELGGKVQWVHSYIAGDRTFCIYLAENEALVREHALISGFPASRIVETPGLFDPTAAGTS